jgi:hypothetical protein
MTNFLFGYSKFSSAGAIPEHVSVPNKIVTLVGVWNIKIGLIAVRCVSAYAGV